MMRPRPAPLLPPRGIFVGTRILFDQGLPLHLKYTLLQLMAMTWMSSNHTTPRLTFNLLEQITGKDRNTLRGHLVALGNYGAALRLQYAEHGQFNVILADWLFTNRDVPSVVKMPSQKYDASYFYDDDDDSEVKNYQNLESNIENHHHHHHDNDNDDDDDNGLGAESLNAEGEPGGDGAPEGFQADDLQASAFELDADLAGAFQADTPRGVDFEPDAFESGAFRAGGFEAAGPFADVFDTGEDSQPARDMDQRDTGRVAGRRGSDQKQSLRREPPFELPPALLPPALRGALLQAGIFPGLLDEIARRVAGGEYSPEEVQSLLDWTRADSPDRAAGLFISRLRNGARPPAQYQTPACPRCGQRGSHARGCPRGYSAEF